MRPTIHDATSTANSASFTKFFSGIATTPLHAI
jgi:hypothetical protein